MRLFLKDSERRPDPEPVKTDDRKAVLAGTALWIVGLVAVLLFVPARDGNFWVLWTCFVGLALGIAGLIYTSLRKR